MKLIVDKIAAFGESTRVSGNSEIYRVLIRNYFFPQFSVYVHVVSGTGPLNWPP